MSKILVTSALPYINGVPHLGQNLTLPAISAPHFLQNISFSPFPQPSHVSAVGYPAARCPILYPKPSCPPARAPRTVKASGSLCAAHFRDPDSYIIRTVLKKRKRKSFFLLRFPLFSSERLLNPSYRGAS